MRGLGAPNSRENREMTVTLRFTNDGRRKRFAKLPHKFPRRSPSAPGPSEGEFTIPPVPEALRPNRIPPSNAITITFRAYESGRVACDGPSAGLSE